MEKRKMTKEEIREYLLRSREMLEGDLPESEEEEELFVRASEILFGTASGEENGE